MREAVTYMPSPDYYFTLSKPAIAASALANGIAHETTSYSPVFVLMNTFHGVPVTPKFLAPNACWSVTFVAKVPASTHDLILATLIPFASAIS